MKCQVCGTDSGKYPLCAVCNQERERGRIIKCEKCGRWHYWDVECPQIQKKEFLYECRKSLLTDNEKKFYAAILKGTAQRLPAVPADQPGDLYRTDR